jgi:hypothetical protein
VGAGLLPALKSQFPSLAVEGVTYDAGILTNMRADGADPVGVTNAKKVYELAASKCPNTISIFFQDLLLMNLVLISLSNWRWILSRRCHPTQSNRISLGER